MAPEQGLDRKKEASAEMKDWIYKLSKADLITELETLGLDADGTVEDLRRRLSRYVDQHPDEFRAAAPTVSRETPATTAPPPAADPELRPAKVMSQMRKWGLHFDGKDPWAFLERVDELRVEYEYPDELVLRGLPEVLRGDALLWYRNARDGWRDWTDFVAEFKTVFLPHRYRLQLQDEIRERKQKTGEASLRYSTAVLSLMRRAGGYTEEERVERLYQNMHPDYQWRIRRRDVRTTRDLLLEATEFEDLQRRQKTATAERPLARDAPITATTASYNRAEYCWRCKQRGHTRFECRRAQKKFCSQCGKDDVWTRDCHPAPGNEPRVGEATAAPRPSP